MTQLTEFEKVLPTHPPTDRTDSRDAVASKKDCYCVDTNCFYYSYILLFVY